MQDALGRTGRGTSTALPVAHRVRPEPEIPAGFRQRPFQRQPDAIFRATIVLGEAIVHWLWLLCLLSGSKLANQVAANCFVDACSQSGRQVLDKWFYEHSRRINRQCDDFISFERELVPIHVSSVEY